MKTFKEHNLERKAKILGLRTMYRTLSKDAMLTSDEAVEEIIDDLSTIVEALAEVALEAQSVVEEIGKEVSY